MGKSEYIIHVGCWAHTRRYFDEARAATKKTGAAEQALSSIGKLYLIEKRLRAQLQSHQITGEEFVRSRRAQVEPILESFKIVASKEV